MKRLTQTGIALTAGVLFALGLTGCKEAAKPAAEQPQAEAMKEAAEHPETAKPKDHPAH